jgi:two-component system sensor histidine kinase UhpB
MREERIALLEERMTQVVKAQEEERQRVARELHDQAGQTLTALQLGFSHIEASGPTPEVQEKAASLRQLAVEAMHIIRNLALALRPSALDELGLPEALRYVTETLAGRTGIRAKLEVSGSPRRLPAETEVTLFRIVQEALTNVAKHAQANLVTVKLAFDNPRVELSIEDDGVGFDVERALGAERRKSLGLIGMQERCQLIGSRLQIRSRPGKGTRLVISVPSAAGEAAPPEIELSKSRQDGRSGDGS